MLLLFLWLQLWPVLVVLAIGFGVERLASSSRNLNIAWTAIYWLLQVTVGSVLSVLVFSVIHGGRIIHASVSDGHRISVALVLAFLYNALVVDFFYYWLHRLQHGWRWLWAEHEFHHSDEAVNVTTTWRHHWLEIPLHAMFVSLPAALFLKPPAVTIPVAFVLVRMLADLNHLNIRVNFGWFNRALSNPQFHRIHHSSMSAHIDKNFAAVLPLWDMLFGTYYHPQKGEFPPTGLISNRTVTSLKEAFLMPFANWKLMLTESSAHNQRCSLGQRQRPH